MVYLFKSRTSLSKDRFTVCFWHSNQAELILHDEYIGIEPMTSKSYSLQEPQSCAFDQLRHTCENFGGLFFGKQPKTSKPSCIIRLHTPFVQNVSH